MTFSSIHSSVGALSLSLLLLAGCGGQDASTPEAAAPAENTAAVPPGHPPIDAGATQGVLPEPVINEATLLTWDSPEGWVEEPPANSMRQAQYRVPGEAGDGQCVAYYFGAGQGGDTMANAERWADQFMQPDGRSSRELLQTEKQQVGDMDVLMVQVTGTYNEGGMMMTGAPAKAMPDYMLLGAVVEGPDSNWFFKFTGPEQTVRDNEDAFRGLVESVRGQL
jgi:hypothetical protein